MASIIKRGESWRAEVYVRGRRTSKTFRTKAEAKQWAARQETILEQHKPGRETFREVLERYAREVSPTKRGERWECLRIAMICKDPVADVRIGDLTPADLGAWRDRRAAKVSPATVLREITLLSAVLTHVRKEWRLIGANPMSEVRKPKEPPHRTRLPTVAEMDRLAYAAQQTPVLSMTWRAFQFAMETGMRQGEICQLARADIDGRVAHLKLTKNGDARDVPLSARALALIEDLPDNLFATTADRLSANWRNLCKRAAVDGLTFHDSRHAFCTAAAKKVDALTLAKIIGHRNLGQLLVYFNETAADIAKRLD